MATADSPSITRISGVVEVDSTTLMSKRCADQLVKTIGGPYECGVPDEVEHSRQCEVGDKTFFGQDGFLSSLFSRFFVGLGPLGMVETFV